MAISFGVYPVDDRKGTGLSVTWTRESGECAAGARMDGGGAFWPFARAWRLHGGHWPPFPCVLLHILGYELQSSGFSA